MRAFLGLLALIVLGGCNAVISQQPWFTEADRRDPPQLRPGLWAIVEPDCQFTPQRDWTRWPDCAEPLRVYSANGLARPREDRPRQWSRLDALLTSTRPHILQLQLGETSLGYSEKRTPADPPYRYGYYTFLPIDWDAKHRVIAMRLTGVSCDGNGISSGMQKKAEPAADANAAASEATAAADEAVDEAATDSASTPEAAPEPEQSSEESPPPELPPGLKWLPDGNCTAESRGALLEAATRSLETRSNEARWIRAYP